MSDEKSGQELREKMEREAQDLPYAAETTLQRALREKAEQEAAQAAATVQELLQKPPAAPPVLRTVQIVLTLSYDARGAVVRTQGSCNGRAVLDMRGAGDHAIGRAAKETLRAGGLLALLGRS